MGLTFSIVHSFEVVLITQNALNIQNNQIVPDHIGFVMQIAVGDIICPEKFSFRWILNA
jgi:hypothetical protein